MRLRGTFAGTVPFPAGLWTEAGGGADGEEVLAVGTRRRGSGRALPVVLLWGVGANLGGTWVKFSREAHWWWVLGSRFSF